MIYNTHLFKSLLKPFILGAFLLTSSLPTKADVVEIISFGHSAFLVKGGGHSVLINPFNPVACAKGLKKPNVKADVILVSSELPDEGSKDYKGTYFSQPGSYAIKGVNLQGSSAPHDRLGGRRFGYATAWQWNQGGFNFLHLGGSVTPINLEEKLLFGRPDVLFIAVGGGAKVYNGQEAAKVVKDLNPRIVIPAQYARSKVLKECDQTDIQPFLQSMEGVKVKKVGKSYKIRRKSPEETVIYLMP